MQTRSQSSRASGAIGVHGSWKRPARACAFGVWLVGGALLPQLCAAADQIKADNTNGLNQAAAWSGGGVPGSGDWAVWNSALTSERTNSIGNTMTWGGLKVTNSAYRATISHLAGKTLTLSGVGGVGIDLSQAAADFTVACLLKLGGGLAFDVAGGRLLTVGTQTLTLNGNALTVSGAGATTISSSTASGAGSIVKNGSGLLTLSGNNAHTGGVTLNGGLIAVNNNNAIGTGVLTVNGGAISNGGNRTVANNIVMNTNTAFVTTGGLTLSGEVSGTGMLVKDGGGAQTLTLSGANTYSGDTVLKSGNIIVSHAQGLGTAVGKTVSTNKGTIVISGGITVAENMEIGDGQATGTLRSDLNSATNTCSGLVTVVENARIGAASGGVLRLAGGLSLASNVFFYFAPSAGGTIIIDCPVSHPGEGVNFLGGDGGTNVLNSTGNDWAGSRIYYGSTVVLGADNAFPVGAGLNLGGDANQHKGVLSLNGKSQSLSYLQSSSSSNAFDDLVINESAVRATLTVNQKTATSFGGLLAGNLTLVKGESGSLTLTNSNTYSGGTVVRGGVLVVGAGGACGTLGAGAITNNASLVFNRSDAVVLDNPVAGDGVIVKDGAGDLTLSAADAFGGSITVSNGALLVSEDLSNAAVEVRPGAAVGAAGTSAAALGSLSLAAGAVVRWNYDAQSRAGGRLEVAGTLTLPAVASLAAAGAASLHSDRVLFSAASVAGATDLSGWALSGVPETARVVVVRNQVVLSVSRGMVLTVQ